MVGFPSGFGIAAACMAEVEFLSSISLAGCHSIFYEKVILTSFTSTSFEVIALNQKKVGMACRCDGTRDCGTDAPARCIGLRVCEFVS